MHVYFHTQDEMARDVRAKVDTDKQLERSRKDLHDMRAKLAPLLKEQLAAEEEIKRLTERKYYYIILYCIHLVLCCIYIISMYCSCAAYT